MPNEINYFDTPYTFINPVRYFKANDPYYYEVDNIPIKQLEETSNFLKDQVDGLLSKGPEAATRVEIDRKGFSELKPYATGNDRKIRVKPGKFTARINNAFDITPLQTVAQIGGFANDSPGIWAETNTWQFETVQGPVVRASLDEFQLGLVGAAYMMNGLYERTFVYPVGDEDGIDLAANPFKYIGSEAAITWPGYPYDKWNNTWMFAPFPNYTGVQPGYNVAVGEMLGGPASIVKSVAKNQGRMESTFIKRWRGAIRTSIVDVPEELRIPIPDYDEDDFFYVDASGTQQPITSNQRIDLLFIYSKAIDETTTTLNKFNANGEPQQITRAELGIVKGAGVGLSRQVATATNPSNLPGMPVDLLSIRDADGTPLMFAHPGDEGGTTVGVSSSAGVIKGSFPSPDDLMNLAPVLSENLELNSLPLIGQSILPIAYIRVQKPVGGGPILALLTDEDIIDIRPFFRTTELAYNERAGIAAATPQISIANPVVSEAHLEGMRQEMITPLDYRIQALEAISHVLPTGGGGGGGGTPTGPVNEARVIAAGQVLGNFWGPEGALIRMAQSNTGGSLWGTTMSQFADLIETDFGYKSGSINFWPDWDKASWYGPAMLSDRGIADCINVGLPWLVEPGAVAGSDMFMQYAPPWKSKAANSNSSFDTIKQAYATTNVGMFNWKSNDSRPSDKDLFGHGDRKELNDRLIQVNYVSKKINLNFTQTNWVADYHVKVSLLNCLPLSDGPASFVGHPVDNDHSRQTSDIWVQKFKDYFIINVSWAALSIHPSLYDAKQAPWQDRNNAEKFAGFVHPHPNVGYNVPGNWGEPYAAPAGISMGGTGSNDPENRRWYFDKGINRGYGSGIAGGWVGAGGTGAPRDPEFADPDWISTVTPLVYPSVQWEVVGVGSTMMDNALGANGNRMQEAGPTVACV